ncbi:MAG: Appr-1-p processing protein [Caulobacter sp.]|nr:Appr-1-p processing protein [Caulobacter sp.]
MKVILTATDSALADAWDAQFDSLQGVQVHRGSIFDVSADALVSPANSFGFMDGGIDALYSDRFGWDLQLRLRRLILDRHFGELLVGHAELVETENPTHPYLVAAPTMRIPMVLEPNTVNPYLATRAALLLARAAEQSGGVPIGVLAFPGMGTGVGRVPPELCARQMRMAYDDVFNPAPRLPSSWAEASERHQLLYTDQPTRLQY